MPEYHTLDDRKKAILKAVIEEYILTAEPVGSRTIAKNHMLGLSSATIRNEMADLEELGYLIQPHTSAGRVPSEKGYRLYVDELVQDCELSIQELQRIRDALDGRIKDYTDVMKAASGIISELTEYTTVAVTPALSQIVLKAVQVVPVETGKALVFVVMENESIQNTLVEIDPSISASDLIHFSQVINQQLTGKTFDKVYLEDLEEQALNFNVDREKMHPILQGVLTCLKNAETAHVYTDGAINMLNHPEFSDIIRAKEFLTMMQHEDMMLKLITESMSDGGIMIKIGTENIFDEVKDCSIITATYSVNDKVIGSIGIIGPTRMQYGRVISSMNAVKNSLNSQMRLLLGGAKPESGDKKEE